MAEKQLLYKNSFADEPTGVEISTGILTQDGTTVQGTISVLSLDFPQDE